MTERRDQIISHPRANMLARYAHFQDERTLELGDRLVARLFPKWKPDA